MTIHSNGKWKILARHKNWVAGATITEMFRNGDPKRRFTAKIGDLGGILILESAADNQTRVSAVTAVATRIREQIDSGTYVSAKTKGPGMRRIELTTTITSILCDHGWTEFCGPALGLKSFETAVGVKEAAAHLSPGDSFNRTLMGSYQSEGRNVLEAHAVLIPTTADLNQVRRLTTQFAIQVDSVVSDTYAARLNRIHN